MPEDPDRGTLARVAEGDTESFGLLVSRHQDRLVRLCERLLGNPEEARDAAQEVFLSAFRKAAGFTPQGKVYTWLYRIAVNHCLNRLRRRRLVRFFSFGELGPKNHEDTPPFEPEDPHPDPDRRLEARRRWSATRRAIEALPGSQRAVLVLTKLEGFSYRETAEILDISLSAVESRLFRAMRNLIRAQETAAPSVSTPETGE
jgi:RNA polymerase sigma-70 factor (ECF subfamily)